MVILRGMATHKQPSINIDANQILIAEYHTIASSMVQAHADRSRAASFDPIRAGVLASAPISTVFSTSAPRSGAIALSGLYLPLTAVGILTRAKLARLRAGWQESGRTIPSPPTTRPSAGKISLRLKSPCGAGFYFPLINFREIHMWGWILLVIIPVMGFAGQWTGYKNLLNETT